MEGVGHAHEPLVPRERLAAGAGAGADVLVDRVARGAEALQQVGHHPRLAEPLSQRMCGIQPDRRRMEKCEVGQAGAAANNVNSG